MVDTHFRTFFPFSVVLHLCVQHNKYIMVILGGGLQCLSTLPPKEGLPIIQVYYAEHKDVKQQKKEKMSESVYPP
jgi:hypothetical protein